MLTRRRSGFDQRQGAVAIADHDPAVPRVDADIVGVLAELGDPERGEVVALEAPQRAVAARNVDGVGRGHVGHALRLGQTADPFQHRASREIHDAKAAVAKFGDEQSLASKVDREVIDPSAYLTERNLGVQLEYARMGRP